MQFGIGLPNYGRHASFESVRRVALAAEELGYDSVWTTDHILVPAQDVEPYGHILESVVTLAMVGAVTSQIRIGTSVIVLPMRNPVLFAKQMATIDAATGGRTIVGVGVGWNAPEFKNLSANFKNRGRRLDEDIALLRTLWSSESVKFHGAYTEIVDSVFGPLPARKEIPLWIGGNDAPALARAARFGDAWHSTGASPQVVAKGVQFFREHKPARPLSISARLTIDLNPAVPSDYEYRGAPRRRLTGSDDAVRALLREYAQAGLQHAALFFSAADVEVVLAQMKRFMRELAPEFSS